MPDTIEALLVVMIAVLPGALHTWASEREAGRWGVGLSDRLLRFIGTTSIYAMVFAYPAHLVWVHQLHRRIMSPDGKVTFANAVARGAAPWWFWLLPLAYAGIPILGGTIAGVAVQQRWPRISRIVAGRVPAPRAWDFLFSAQPVGVVRARLKSDGRWVGGRFGADSYAAGYPELPQDLFLERSLVLLADGEFAEGDSPDGYQETGSGLLIKWDDIEELEFFEMTGVGDAEAQSS
jgi:hypothetical protein